MPTSRSDMPIVHPLMNFMYSYIALVVPVIPNLFVSFLSKLAKLITASFLIVRWRTLEY
jgi:phage-related protein